MTAPDDLTAQALTLRDELYDEALKDDPEHPENCLGGEAAALLGALVERVRELEQGLWDVDGILGFDHDGDPTPAALAYPPLIEHCLRNAREQRKDYDDACDEVGAAEAERDAAIARADALTARLDAAEKDRRDYEVGLLAISTMTNPEGVSLADGRKIIADKALDYVEARRGHLQS